MINLKLLLLILLIWLQYLLWFGNNGFYDCRHIINDIAVYQAINNRLKNRNDQLLNEINGLNNDQDIIEEYARNELNMIKPEENFYRFVFVSSK